MTSFLFIISFLLHIISLFAIYQLFQQIQSQRKENNSSEQVMAVLESYLQEIKSENDRLQQLVSQEEKSQEAMQQKQTEPSKKNQEEEDDRVLANVLDKHLGYDVETSLESRILQLHSQGMTIEDIAKKLNCGKTEAELIIKFHQKA